MCDRAVEICAGVAAAGIGSVLSLATQRINLLFIVLKSTILTPPILYSSRPLFLLVLLRPYSFAASPQRKALEAAVVACP
jgi:hypothetical protein